MSRKDLLDAVAELARQDPAQDPRWRDLTEGTLSEADRAALSALAERSPTAREAFEVYRPLDEAALERITEGILMQLARVREDSVPPSSQTRPLRMRSESAPPVPLPPVPVPFPPVSPPPVSPDAAAPSPGLAAAADEPDATSVRVDSLAGTSVAPNLEGSDVSGREDDRDEQPASGPRTAPLSEASWPRDAASAADPTLADRVHRTPTLRLQPAPAHPTARLTAPVGWRSRMRSVAAVAAWTAGALLLLFLALRPAPFAPGEAPLPVYSIATPGGARGPSQPLTGALRLAPGERFELVLRPASRVRVPLTVSAYLLREGEAQRWDIALPIDDNGAVRIAGAREELFRDRPDGEWDAVFLVGRAGARTVSPGAIAAALREGRPGEVDGYSLIRERVVLTPAR